MRHRFPLILVALSALLLLAAAPAASAKKRAKPPTITRVSPMRTSLGAVLTIRGRGFSARRSRNTVIFRASSGRSAFVKPRRASSRKLVVVVSAAVGRLLTLKSGSPTATRLRLRVLSGKRFSKWTRRRLSPVVVAKGGAAPGGIPGGGTPTPGGGTPTPGGGTPGGGTPGGGTPPPPVDCTPGDYDGDLLSGSVEASIGTDPCKRDTDGDGVEDGYEEQSAIDLNHYPASPPRPYPGSRPYPNALDPSDGNTDYDGDGLTLGQESLLWLRYSADGVLRSGRPTTLANLLYSDGLQASIVPAPAAPNPVTQPLAAWALDINDNGSLTDDERDGDADGLTNWDEANGRMNQNWWPAQHDGQIEPTESKYPLDFLDNADLPKHDAFANPDIDGDGVFDGADDNDHDGLSNQFEVRRPADWENDAIVGFPTAVNPWAYTNPFNPCKPFNSERCHRFPPFGYYDSDEVPPIGPNPPGGYPTTHPDTPDG